MQRLFEITKVTANHTLVTCSVYERPGECLALFSCLFEGFSIKTFHVDSFRPTAINIGLEYATFIGRALRMLREGLTPEEASLLEI